jgi:hypothetical protein
MKVALTGTIDGQNWPELGGDITLPDAIAQDMIDNGFAEKIEKATKSTKVETASVDPVVETAAVKPAKARKTAPSEA